jgi:hypothetical protein
LCAGGVAAVLSCGDDQAGTGGGGNGASTSNSFTGGGGGGFPSSGSGSTSVSTYSTGVGPPPTEEAECQGHVYQCGDIVDNDMDGLIDYQDPDCLGPCDNTEDSLYGGIPGQNNAPCKQDCYWDQDGGPGNDDCYWDHQCDFHSVDPNYYPEPWLGDQCEYQGPDFNITPVMQTCAELDAAQSTTCHDICGPLTPNGCDCFGCCELPSGSGAYVWLGSLGIDEDTVCTLDQVGNPAVCHPCDPVAACLNPCDTCELCLGKPFLPPECFNGEGGGGGGQECDPGVQQCGLEGQALCPSGYYCITGCCIAEPQ